MFYVGVPSAGKTLNVFLRTDTWRPQFKLSTWSEERMISHSLTFRIRFFLASLHSRWACTSSSRQVQYVYLLDSFLALALRAQHKTCLCYFVICFLPAHSFAHIYLPWIHISLECYQHLMSCIAFFSMSVPRACHKFSKDTKSKLMWAKDLQPVLICSPLLLTVM